MRLIKLLIIIILSLILVFFSKITDSLDDYIRNFVISNEESIVETETETEIESETETETESESESETETESETAELRSEEKFLDQQIPENASSHNNTAKNIYSAKKVKELISQTEPTGKKIAFLTFDDGPTHNTEAVLDILEAKGVEGTFFMIGKNIDENSAHIVKRVYNGGHSIGTHTLTHNYSTLYPGGCADVETILSETKESMIRIRNILDENFYSKVFRYPGGKMSWDQECMQNSISAMHDIKIDWIDWNSMNGDSDANFMPYSIEDAVNNVFYTLNNTNIAVVLMHDTYGKELTVQALPYIIDSLREQGFEFGIIE